MIYRTLAGEQVSQLGFGAMRLPMAGAEVNVPEAIRMMHRALEGGINYIDTAWVYHGGKSEGIVGQALAGSKRQQVMIATKSPVWDVKEKADFPKFLDEQLRRLDTDYIDFYLLHALNAGSWANCQKLDALDFLERAKAAGKIRHFGFSFHDTPEVFSTILHAYPWEFCQVQYNYLDQKPANGHPGLDSAAAHGTGLIVMEPLRGGNLAGRMPAAVQSLWAKAPRQRSPADWALRWVWNRSEVGLVLSGMTTMDQLEENLTLSASAGPDNLNAAELKLIEEVADTFRKLITVPCTTCRYCMPCPFGVDIPRNFSSYNEFFMFAENPAVRAGYQWIPIKERALNCTQCGACVSKCPQHIAIPDRMKEVAATFA